MSMCFIVAAEVFALHPLTPIVKELTVWDLKTNNYNNWHFKPPGDFRQLDNRLQTVYGWQTANFHGLSWPRGETDYDEFPSLLLELSRCCRPGCKIFVCDASLVDIVRLVLPGDVVESVVHVLPKKLPTLDEYQIDACSLHNVGSRRHCALGRTRVIVQSGIRAECEGSSSVAPGKPRNLGVGLGHLDGGGVVDQRRVPVRSFPFANSARKRRPAGTACKQRTPISDSAASKRGRTEEPSPRLQPSTLPGPSLQPDKASAVLAIENKET